jgi:hypothetical protein
VTSTKPISRQAVSSPPPELTIKHNLSAGHKHHENQAEGGRAQ